MEWTALILGFTGSLHCLGMCSPLAMSVTNMSSSAVVGRMVYNAGRVSTYAVFGGIIASLGFALPFVKYQNLVSIALGIALVAIGLTRSPVHIPGLAKVVARLTGGIKQLFSRTLASRTPFSTFLLGSLNGMLPCGLSFLALTCCVTLAGPVDGFLFMLLFGVGTLPVMLGFTGIFRWVIDRFQFRPASVTTGMLIFSGIFLIARIFIVHVPHAHSTGSRIVDIILCQ